MTKRFLLIGCIAGMAAVIFGAFGAHFLKRVLSPDHLQLFETGIRYQFYHTFAILVTALLCRYSNRKWTTVAGWLFLAGIFFFSGSLYLLALVQFLELEPIQRILGPLTPLGGLLFIGGWLALMRASIDYKPKK